MDGKKYVKKFSILFIFLLLSITRIHAQYRVTGIVVDENDEPIIGASIEVLGTNNGTVTDFYGNFTLNMSKSGKYTLQVDYVGCKTLSFEVDGEASGKVILVAKDRKNKKKNSQWIKEDNTSFLYELVFKGVQLYKKEHYTEAIKYFEKAAEQGYALAQSYLGWCYEEGKGVKQDYTQAVSWYRKAAEQGDAIAQYNLGVYYSKGRGVNQDYAQAVYWYRKAAEQGDEDAKRHLSEFDDELKKQQFSAQNNQEQPRQKSLATIEWIDFASTVNKREYPMKVGVKSDTKVEEVNVTVNGSLSRGINTVKSDGYNLTIDRTLALSEGVNSIVVSVRNGDGTTTSTKTITYQASNTVQEVSRGKRIALVMGNSNYTNSSPLKNPVNDATDIAKKLESLGFVVIRSLDQDKRGMEAAINDFGMKAQGYDVALFFYAGHGICYKGRNYMIPVDANLSAEEDVEYDCTDASRVLAKMERSNCKMKIMILDACRNLPAFARSWHRSVEGGGFNRMNAPKGTFIAYATAEGDKAEDGKGRNSPYTTALLQTLDVPNLSITELFQEVGDKVVSSTNERQNPWVSSSFRGKFIFNLK